MNKELFYEELIKLGITATEKQKQQLEKFYNIMIEWNEKINLTSITEENEVYLKHFYDSLTLVKICDLNKMNNLCDVGTGAGFPGIVLKIFFPELEVTLIDSLNKRVNYLNEVIELLELNKIEVIHSRIEDYGKKNREKFDVVTARAVAPLNILLEYCIPITKQTGIFIAMKANISQEIINLSNISKILKINIETILEFNLPIEKSKRTLIKVTKKEATPKMFPRNNSIIKKQPLK